MSVVDDKRAEASAVARLAGGKLDWCAEAVVIKRYAGIPAMLDDIRRNAEMALRGAQRMRREADEMAERESATQCR